MDNKFYQIHKRYPNFLTKAITLSYDDGRSFDRKMIKILNEYGIKCTFNLFSGSIGRNQQFVSSDEIEELYAGHEVAAHSLTHPHLQTLDIAGIVYQIMKDRENLENFVKRPVRGFAYPFSLCEKSGMIDAISACGVKYARTTVSNYSFDLQYDLLRFKPTCHQADSRLPELAEKFFAPDDPKRVKLKLFYIWGHSYEYENNWEKLDNMCKLIGNHNDVWYATNIEIFDYLSAFDQIEHSANGKYIHNPTAKDLYAVVDGKEIVIESGKSYIFD